MATEPQEVGAKMQGARDELWLKSIEEHARVRVGEIYRDLAEGSALHRLMVYRALIDVAFGRLSADIYNDLLNAETALPVGEALVYALDDTRSAHRELENLFMEMTD